MNIEERTEQSLKDNPFNPCADLIRDLLAALKEANRNLEFAHKRAKVLANMLDVPTIDSPAVTGTILGTVRSSVEKNLAELAEARLIISGKTFYDVQKATAMDCAEIAFGRGLNQNCLGRTEFYLYGKSLASGIVEEINRKYNL